MSATGKEYDGIVEQPSRVVDLDHHARVLVTAKAFAALADPVRLRIVELLDERKEATVGELTAVLPVSQPRVSVHLRCLTDCGFTAVRREGRRAHYRLAGGHVADMVKAMRAHADAAAPGLLGCLHCEPADGEDCC